MMPSVDHPAMLGLLLGCIPALMGGGARWLGISSLARWPRDTLSTALDWALRGLAALPVALIVLGLAGLHEGQRVVHRQASGAHVVVALDRSLSMDEPFALRGERARESKTHAAARLLAAFYARRPHDMFGLVAFSTSPIPVMKLTAHRDAVRAAIAAMDQPALANTDIGAGIAMGLAQFAQDTPGAARVLLLISDGAGAIPDEVRETIRRELAAAGAHIYYLYLRSGDDPPLAEARDDSADLTRPAGLDGFLRGLGAPYQGFEARDAGAVEQATRRIEALETRATAYDETTPRRDLDVRCDAAAAVCLAISLLAQLAERRLAPMPA
jgi:mxaC protein